MEFYPVKKKKRLIWKALDRGTGRCIAWVVGDRDTATFRRLWSRIMRVNCVYYTDDWDGYAKVIPVERHVIGKRGTCRIESDNANTRHRLGRMTRRTKVVSRSERMLDLSIRLWNYLEVEENFRECQKAALSIFD